MSNLCELLISLREKNRRLEDERDLARDTCDVQDATIVRLQKQVKESIADATRKRRCKPELDEVKDLKNANRILYEACDRIEKERDEAIEERDRLTDQLSETRRVLHETAFRSGVRKGRIADLERQSAQIDRLTKDKSEVVRHRAVLSADNQSLILQRDGAFEERDKALEQLDLVHDCYMQCIEARDEACAFSEKAAKELRERIEERDKASQLRYERGQQLLACQENTNSFKAVITGLGQFIADTVIEKIKVPDLWVCHLCGVTVSSELESRYEDRHSLFCSWPKINREINTILAELSS